MRRYSGAWLVVALAAVTAAANATQPVAKPLSLDSSTRARSLRPGEVVLITVTTSRDVAGVGGDAFDSRFTFWPARDSSAWHALVGIPLNTAPGSFIVALQATDAVGSKAVGRISLKVARRQFATRRLKVNPRFVNPPASMIPRIKREEQVLAELFARPASDRLWRGPFTVPVPGTATSSFGRMTVLNGRSRGRHQGTDFRASLGTPVNAPNAGEVVLASDLYYSGKTIVLDHGGGLLSLFGHLSRIAVPVGARVGRGDHVGDAGATGRVTGPHLHWAVRLRGTTVDPLSLIAALAKLDERQP